ncbi:MAG: BT_3928 family protein, partial [Bacteroidota bacterium]
MNLIIQLIRIVIGLLFIISGLIKANDTLGFSYKLDEYFEVFGTEWLKSFSLFISIFMCALEMLLGFMLLIGSRIKLTLWLILLMVVFFALLNFYSGYFDKVRECGCFGDAIKLTPWQEFVNNIVMLVLTIFIFIWKKNIRPLFEKTAENIFVFIVIVASFGFPLYTYNYLPVKDFRPYAIGKNIQEGMKLPPEAKQDSVVMIFIYEKDGKQIELTPEQIKTIDSTYKYIDRKDKIIREGEKPLIHDFSIVSGSDGNDYTEKILNDTNYYFFLVAYDINKTPENIYGKINDFAKLCRNDGIGFIALTASDNIES